MNIPGFAKTEDWSKRINPDRNWSKVQRELESKVRTAHAELAAAKAQLAQQSLLAELGDAAAQAQAVNLQNDIAALERKLTALTVSQEAADDYAQEAVSREQNKQRTKALRSLTQTHMKFEAALRDIDKSFGTLAKRYEAASELQTALLDQTQQLGIARNAGTQLRENIKRPLASFNRCLGSHLPFNTGPSSDLAEPLAIASLAPDLKLHIEPLLSEAEQ